MTIPVAMSGSTKSAGRIGTVPQSGWLTVLSTRSFPAISSFTSTVWSCSTSFSAASFETIHALPSTSALTYVTFGFAQRLVTPWIVSGRSVAVGMNASPIVEHDERELDHFCLVPFEEIVVPDRVLVDRAVPDRVHALNHMAGLIQVFPLPLDEPAVGRVDRDKTPAPVDRETAGGHHALVLGSKVLDNRQRVR